MLFRQIFWNEIVIFRYYIYYLRMKRLKEKCTVSVT